MRMGVLLLAVICALAPAGARADEGEPDWVFEGEFYSSDVYLGGLSVSLDPLPADFPWEEVAYGELYFWVHGNGYLSSTVPVLVTATCGESVNESWTGIWSYCDTDHACIGHYFDIRDTFTVYSPTSVSDFHVRVELHEGDGGECSGGPACDEVGGWSYTLSLYAHPTASASASWSTIKSRY